MIWCTPFTGAWCNTGATSDFGPLRARRILEAGNSRYAWAQHTRTHSMTEPVGTSISRRRLLTMIGLSAGSSVMYQAMHSLGLAAETNFQGPIHLSAAPKGASG